MKPLLVGEMNPLGDLAEFDLYPLPEGCAGARLAKILGLSRGQYLRRFNRVNLCRGKWSTPVARAEARVLQATRRSLFVLLGRRVCDAFGVQFRPFELLGVPGRRYVVLPHPSGRCRLWNEPRAAQRARQVVMLGMALDRDARERT